MEAPDAAIMEQRWGFLAPWCNVLQYRINYRTLEDAPLDVWGGQSRALHVMLPRRVGIYGEINDERSFQIEFQNTREALSLLAAVEHVDHMAWKFLLLKYCGVDLGKPGDEIFETEIPVRFCVLIESQAETDLIQLCGVNQRRYMSEGYVNTLGRIAELGGLGKNADGVDLDIPVRVIFNSTPKYDVMNKLTIEPIQNLVNIQAAEKIIREEWESYNWSLENQPVDSGMLRCTLVLEPMIADLRVFGCGNEIVETMARFVGENVWFSQLSLKAAMGCLENQDEVLMSFRQMMAVVFDATRRSRELANTRYCSRTLEHGWDSDPLQMGTVTLQCDSSLGPSELGVMFSALVLNQTTRHLSIRMQMESNNHKDWWKWVAYAFFSKRAQTCSALESLELSGINDVEIEDVKAFSAVVATEHPEEVICGIQSGLVPERDAALKQGSPVQWKPPRKDQPHSNPSVVKFGSTIPSILTFGDDGESKWVNVLIPGFGHCLVQRSDLEFHPVDRSDASSSTLTSLTLRFGNFSKPKLNGLPLLLSACGASLRSLTIQGSVGEVDANMILQCCPKLRDLTLQKGWVIAQFDLTEVRTRKQHIPVQSFNWEDVTALANELSKSNNSFTRCVRRLAIRLTGMNQVDNVRWAHYGSVLTSYLNALLEMLMVNDYLEYFKITVPSQSHEYAKLFRKHHNKTIRRGGTLSIETKVALLSVMLARTKMIPFIEETRTRRKKKVRRSSALTAYHQTFANICAFAASAPQRQVYFQQEHSENTPSELC
ncbi:hypothetical protein PF007_g484 [Phytophthora fragariae]|nr:hypothetical protein PF007_g484 [Phytophthora fragariae]